MSNEVQIELNGNGDDDTRLKELNILHTKAIKLSETFTKKFLIPTLSYTDFCRMKKRNYNEIISNSAESFAAFANSKLKDIQNTAAD